MKIGVAGLWHLGSVTAACLAQAGFEVTGTDDVRVVSGLIAGKAPLFEPGLDELLAAGIKAGRLQFSADPATALHDIGVLWITYDTPVDDNDQADVESVVERASALLPLLRNGAVVLISSQLPVGTTRALCNRFASEHPDRDLQFAYSPENLRLGAAITAFVQADRIVVGCESDVARQRLEPLISRLGRPVIWMGLESAEMVKHTINAFLATSITFVNEIATLCERLGADAGEVEAGIRSEPRIGQRAYVTPGGAFGGGTLARDVAFLSNLAAAEGIPVPLIAGILPSNLQHVGWVFRRICDLFGQSGEAQSGEAQSGEAQSGEAQSGAARSGEARSGGARLAGVRAAVLGLAYKANTSSLRRSTAVELCSRLYAAGAEVRAFDPAVSTLPPELAAAIRVLPTAAAAFTGADVLVVATEWSEFKELESAAVVTAMRRPLVIDQNGFLAQTLGRSGEVAYLRVGKAA